MEGKGFFITNRKAMPEAGTLVKWLQGAGIQWVALLVANGLEYKNRDGGSDASNFALFTALRAVGIKPGIWHKVDASGKWGPQGGLLSERGQKLKPSFAIVEPVGDWRKLGSKALLYMNSIQMSKTQIPCTLMMNVDAQQTANFPYNQFWKHERMADVAVINGADAKDLVATWQALTQKPVWPVFALRDDTPADEVKLFAAANKTGGFIDMDILVSGKHADWLPAIGGIEPPPPPPPQPPPPPPPPSPEPVHFTGSGKGVYIWLPKNIGTPTYVAEALKASKTDFVAIKINDAGVVYQNLQPYIDAIRNVGIAVGGWGYIYLKWNALAEAKGAVAAINLYKPDFYLIDAEVESLFQFAPAKVFATEVRKYIPDLPMALSSYWKPSWHKDVPYAQLRAICQFDAPQVYARGSDPKYKLSVSKAEYAVMTPKLPFTMPGNDMYFEGGIKPTPQQVIDALTWCWQDNQAHAPIFWSMDQMKVTPDLWAAYSSFSWKDGPSQLQPLYSAVTTDALNIRPEPNTTKPPVGVLPKGTRVDVYFESGTWAAIDETKTRWCSTLYLKKV